MTETVDSESELIAAYLAPLTLGAPGAFGLQDDAALLTLPPGNNFVITADPIIAGVHFFPSERADDVAWKALAVNMSDLAAKGAEPFAYMMTLAFPAAPAKSWIELFAKGLAAAQADFGCHLIGGDTDRTPGPLSIGITAIGIVPERRFVRRRGARAGDDVFVSGTLGDSALGLILHEDASRFSDRLMDGDKSFLLGRYLRPNPRLALAGPLREHANAALDISDGFLKDLGRLAGSLGMTIAFDALPLSPPVRAVSVNDADVVDAVLGGGDDYEILAAVPTERSSDFVSEAARVGVSVTKIGTLSADAGIRIVGSDGRELKPRRLGYDHLKG